MLLFDFKLLTGTFVSVEGGFADAAEKTNPIDANNPIFYHTSGKLNHIVFRDS